MYPRAADLLLSTRCFETILMQYWIDFVNRILSITMKSSTDGDRKSVV